MKASVAALVFLVPAAAGAQTVERQASGTTARLQAVSVVSDQVVWASGARGTYVITTDGGRRWTAAVVPGADSLEFRDVHAFDARRAVLLAAGPGDRSRLYHTTDGGAHWNLVFTNPDPAAFYDCFDFRGNTGVVVSDAVNGHFPLLRTTDGGASWQPWMPPGYQDIAAAEGEGGFAASGTCLTLDDRGRAWLGTAGQGRVIRFGPDGSAAVSTPIIHGQAAGIASLAFRSATIGL
ncbi:MAG: hypothetical protein R2882_11230, partial [Gemmatimonadales bacterium]